MALITKTDAMFNPELVTEIFNKVKGHSSLAKLCAGNPLGSDCPERAHP